MDRGSRRSPAPHASHRNATVAPVVEDTTIACAGGCKRRLEEDLRITYCPTCWNVERICTEENAADIAELRARRRSRQELVFRVFDLLRRSGVEDADLLIAELERRLP